jgi:hypothetical protein
VDNITKLNHNKGALQDIRNIIINEINNPEAKNNKQPVWFWILIFFSLVSIIVGIAAFSIAPYNYIMLVLGIIGIIVVILLFCLRFGKKKGFSEDGMKIIDARYGKEIDIFKVYENKDEHGEVKVLRSLVFVSKKKKKKKKVEDGIYIAEEEEKRDRVETMPNTKMANRVMVEEDLQPSYTKEPHVEPRSKKKVKIKTYQVEEPKKVKKRDLKKLTKEQNPASKRRTRRYGEKSESKPLRPEDPQNTSSRSPRKNHYYSNSIDDNLETPHNLPDNNLRLQESNFSNLVPGENNYEIKNSQDFHGESTPQNFYNPSLEDRQIESYEQYERKISNPPYANPYNAGPVRNKDPFDGNPGSDRLDTIEVDLNNFAKKQGNSKRRPRGGTRDNLD